MINTPGGPQPNLATGMPSTETKMFLTLPPARRGWFHPARQSVVVIEPA
jgi:hypothetical protein